MKMGRYHLTDFTFRLLSVLVFMCYGATMVMIVKQFDQVGLYATIFRFLAWQIVLITAVTRHHA